MNLTSSEFVRLPFDRIRDSEFSPRGGAVLVVDENGRARCWDEVTGQPITPEFEHAIDDVAFGPSGQTALAISSSDQRVRLWDIETGQVSGIPFETEDRVSTIAFSPDGETALTVEFCGRVSLWDIRSRRRVEMPCEQTELSVAEFSPDGKVLLTGDRSNRIRLWEVATRQQICQEIRLSDPISAAAFSKDSSMFLAAYGDRTTGLRDVKTGFPLSSDIPLGARVESLAFGEGGPLFGCVDGSVRQWMIKPLESSAHRVILWTQVITGLEAGEHHNIRFLSPSEWRTRRNRLRTLGAPYDRGL